MPFGLVWLCALGLLAWSARARGEQAWKARNQPGELHGTAAVSGRSPRPGHCTVQRHTDGATLMVQH